MTAKLYAPRGADLLLRYVFPETVMLDSYTGAFTVYSEPNGANLLSVTEIAGVNDSVITFADNSVTVLIRTADIDALPVDGSDDTSPAILSFQFAVTSPVDFITKVHGGVFIVQPFGASLSSNAEEVTISFEGTTINISMQGNVLAVDGFNAILAAETDARIEADDLIQDNLDTHKANVSNPHGTTAVQVGAVPQTGNAAPMTGPLRIYQEIWERTPGSPINSFVQRNGSNRWAWSWADASDNFAVSRFDGSGVFAGQEITGDWSTGEFTFAKRLLSSTSMQAPTFLLGAEATYGSITRGNLTNSAYRQYWYGKSPKVVYGLPEWWPSVTDAECFIGLAHAVDATTNITTTHPVSAFAAICAHESGSPDVAAVGIHVGAVNRNFTNPGRQIVAINPCAQALSGATGTKACGTENDVYGPIGSIAFGVGTINNVFISPVNGPAVLNGYDGGGGRWRAGMETVLGCIDATGDVITAYPDSSTGARSMINSEYGGGWGEDFILHYGNKGAQRFKNGSGAVVARVQAANAGNDYIVTLQSAAAAMRVQSFNNTEGNTIQSWREGTGFTDVAILSVGTGGTFSGTAAALRVRHNSVTGRGIATTGTFVTPGADCAEHEEKAPGTGTIQKGQICGYDENGDLTDKWSKARVFVLKSTDPHLVGNDYSYKAGEPPMPPVEPVHYGNAPQAIQGPALREIHDGMSPQEREIAEGKNALMPEIAAAIAEKHAAEMAAWEAAKRQYEDIDHPAYLAAMAAYETDLAAFNAKLEGERQKHDLIVFNGKAPVNISKTLPVGTVLDLTTRAGNPYQATIFAQVPEASVGDWVIPIEGPDDTISAIVVPDDAATDRQVRKAIGYIHSVTPDSRLMLVIGRK